MTRQFTFQVELSGQGETVDEAWRDACEQFALDPGPVPDTAKDTGPAEEAEGDVGYAGGTSKD